MDFVSDEARRGFNSDKRPEELAKSLCLVFRGTLRFLEKLPLNLAMSKAVKLNIPRGGGPASASFSPHQLQPPDSDAHTLDV